MELEQVLKEKGVDSLEAYEAKIKADIERAAQEKEELLRKQIKDLEEIKNKQGDSLGMTRKELDELKSKLLEAEKKNFMEPSAKKPDNEQASGKTEEQWKTEVESREGALTDDQWAKLEAAFASADPATKKLANGSSEGRAAFMDAILGSGAPAQETFRRRVQEKKLSVAEQIQLGLGLLKQNTPSNVQAAGSGFAVRDQVKQQPVNRALINSGGIADLINANKSK